MSDYREDLSSPLWAISRNVRGFKINAGLLIAALLTVLDVILISHYQPASALAILRYTPPLALLLGVLVNLLPIFLPVVALASTAYAVTNFVDGRMTRGASLLLTSFLMWGGAILFVDRTLYSWRWYLLVAAGLGCAVIASVVMSVGDNPPGLPMMLLVVIALWATPSLLWEDRLSDAISQPFLPAEMIVVASPNANRPSQTSNYEAYVLNVDSNWTTLLLERGRTVVIVPTTHISDRTPCELPGQKTYQPLVSIGRIGSADLQPSACLGAS